MLRQKVIFSVLIISILFMGSQPISADGIASSEPIDVRWDLRRTEHTVTDYVIFAENRDEYLGLIQEFDVVEKFSNLQAVVVSLTQDQAKLASQLYKNHVYLLSSFETTIPRIDPRPSPESSLASAQDLDFLDVQQLYDLGYNGTGINIGLLDNGIDPNHPAFDGKIAVQEFISTNGELYTHGTSVAGTIVSDGSIDPQAIGTAINATIYSVAIPTTSSGGISGTHVLAGYDKMLTYNQTVRIVNFSFGGPFPSSPEIMEKFESVNMLVVAAAGNGGPTVLDDPQPTNYPGAHVEPLSVAASDYQGDVAGFSSRGPAIGTARLKPDVMAPGVDIYTATFPGNLFGYVDGTSFSSPTTAGIAATLASALEMNNLTWNAGTLKAAIIRGARGIDGGNYDTGMGMVNALDSYNYLMSTASNGEAKALAVTPLHDRLFRKNFLSDILTSVNGYTVVTSHPADVTVTITGNLSQILFFNSSAWRTDKFSQEIPLYVDSTGAAKAAYSGSMVVSLGNDTQTVPITYNIIGQAIAQLGFDRRHTDWDDAGQNVIGGTNTGEMLDLALDKRIWVEEFDAEITDSLLSKYDIVWISDPVSLDHNLLGPFNGEYFTQNEISALERYVDSGGSLLITFNGVVNNPDFGTIGTNASAINPLISKFGVTTSSDPNNADTTQRITPIFNITSFTGPATHVTTYGNFLSVNSSRADEKNAHVYHLTGTPEKTQLALFDQIGGGRVIISDNNFWTDNGGLTGAQGYSSDDRTLASRAYDWMLQTKRITLNTVTQTANSVTAEFTVYENGVPSTDVLAERLQTTVPYTPLSLTDLGSGKFRLEYEATQDGFHEIQVVTGSDYLRFDLIMNTEGPKITAITENGTVFPEDSFVYRFEFTVVDSTYKVTYSDLTVLVDGAEKSPAEVSRSIEGDKIVLVVQKSAVDPSVSEHVLVFKAKDDAGNEGSITMVFYVGTGPTTSTVSSLESSETGGGGLPVNIGTVLLGFLPLVAIAYGKRKN